MTYQNSARGHQDMEIHNWASAMQPPSIAVARAQYPNSQLLNASSCKGLISFRGKIDQWWHTNVGASIFFVMAHASMSNGGSLLLQGLMIDVEEDFWNYTDTGVFVLWPTNKFLVLLGHLCERDREKINLTRKSRGLHKTLFASWPSEEEVERFLRA